MRPCACLHRVLPLGLLASFSLAALAPAQQALADGPSAGRVLWLRADQGTEQGLSRLVSRWTDQSGFAGDLEEPFGRHRPRLEPLGAARGRPVLHFDGNDVLFRSDGMPTGDYTKVLVFTLEDYASNNNVLSGGAEHAIFYGFGDRAQMYHSGTFVTSDTPTPLGAPTILIATYDASTGIGSLFQNGTLVGTGVAAPHGDPTIQVGAFAFGNFLLGEVGEVMAYDRVLSDLEIRWLFRLLEARHVSGPPVPDVEFSTLPRDGQLLQRDATGTALLTVAGRVLSPGFDAIVVDVFRGGSLFTRERQALQYLGGKAPFRLEPVVEAGLVDYDTEVRLVAGASSTRVADRCNVVCGDALLLNGQSNTVAGDYHGEGLGNQSQSHWIRSFGSSTVASDVALDRHWDLADGELFNDHGAVGSWGLRMAELLVQQHAIPVALINGSVGGTSIRQHQRNDGDPTDLTTIYGRLLYRVREAGLEGAARAMLWYQGESDGEDASGYESQFQLLRESWQLDYPGLEQIYLFQIRKGCGVSFAGVREVQRRFPFVYPDVTVMSTTAAPLHDGCHYYHAGYRELGDRIARLVSRDLHGTTGQQNVDPPDVASAAWLDPNQDAIVLTFRDADDTLLWEAGSEAYFLLEDGVTVVSGSVSGNTITLLLAAPSSSATISYDGHPFDGPWITNARGVGALTFFGVPIL